MPEPTKPPSPRRGRCRLCLRIALLAIVISALVHLLSSAPSALAPPSSPLHPLPWLPPPHIMPEPTKPPPHVFAAGPDGRPDLARSAVMLVSPGLSSFAADTARAGESLRPLLEFAREKVGGEGGAAATEVRLMATAGLRLLEERVQEAILMSCRDVLRASGFRFEDSWVK